ncbi:MAG: hypothetical protein JSR82_23705 [Verrucomicrobia bacterium]|nr:hypothetical protein [Verrucomicrobiota bacterium]
MQTATHETGAPIALDRWAAQAGRNPTTIWRWRKKGWLKPINIAGKLYLTPAAIAEFNDRAARGEFSKDVRPPARTN